MIAFFRKVYQTEQHDVVSSGIFGNKFRDQHPWERTKQVIMTLEEATDKYKG